MPDFDEQTINTESDSSPDSNQNETLNNEPASSPDATLKPQRESSRSNDLVSTVDEYREDIDVQTQGEPKKEDEKGPIPYDRFHEKVTQYNDLEEKFKALQKENESLKTPNDKDKMDNVGRQPTNQPQNLPYIDMGKKNNDELTDWFDENPLGFIGNLAAQIQHETTNAIFNALQNHQRQSTFQARLEEFGEKNDGFAEMLKNGKLNDFVSRNPGYDVFSAYYDLTSEKRQANLQKQIDDAVSKAKEEVKKEFEKNQRAKRELRPIGPGPSNYTDQDHELKDTKIGGGLTSVLAERLSRRRAKGG